MTSRWQLAKLADLEGAGELEFLRGAGLSKKDLSVDGKFPCILYGEIYTKYGTKIESIESSTDKETRVKSSTGDVLIPATTTADAYGIAVARSLNLENVQIGGDINIVRTRNSKILSDFLAYMILSPGVRSDLASRARGTNILHLSNNDIRQLVVPIPPLDEQKRIVAKLDEILGYLNETEGKIASALVNCDALSSAYLDTIFSLEKMSTDQVELQEVTSKIGSGATPRGGNENYKEHGISLIRSMNVHDLKFKHRQLAFLDNAQADQLSNVSVESGDVLLNITGASIARTCVVPDEILPARVNQHVAILRTLHERLLPEFLALQLVAPANKYRLLGIGEESGSTRQALTKAMIQEFQIQIPKDTATQKLIIDKCNEMTSIVGNLRERFVKQRDELDSLRSSILTAAFAGDF